MDFFETLNFSADIAKKLKKTKKLWVTWKGKRLFLAKKGMDAHEIHQKLIKKIGTQLAKSSE